MTGLGPTDLEVERLETEDDGVTAGHTAFNEKEISKNVVLASTLYRIYCHL